MSYAFPPSLHPLRDHLRGLGADVSAFKTDRQAAFMAQQLIGSRVKFPAKGGDMTPTLLQIQKAIPADSKKAGASTPTTPASTRPAAKGAKQGGHRRPLRKSNLPECDISSGIHVFCDGACEPNPGAGGWGLAVYRDGTEIAQGCGGLVETTNNAMELTGMLKAIEWVLHHFMKDKPVTIWCDSMYVVNGCNDWRHKWKKNGWSRKGPNAKKPEAGAIANLDLWKAIDQALNVCSALTIHWVKGHNGTLGNERADELSNIGREQAMAAAGITPEPVVVDYLTAQFNRMMEGA